MLCHPRYVYTRWMDSGELDGFVLAHQGSLHAIQPVRDEYILWQVMTADDLASRTSIYERKLNYKRTTNDCKCYSFMFSSFAYIDKLR